MRLFLLYPRLLEKAKSLGDHNIYNDINFWTVRTIPSESYPYNR